MDAIGLLLGLVACAAGVVVVLSAAARRQPVRVRARPAYRPTDRQGG
ncbi:MAG: hypothetical protein WCG47_20340 [Dermatophilaceae bacterium]